MQLFEFTIQKAKIQQAEAIHRLIQFFTYKNALLPKTLEAVEKEIDSFLVAVPLDGELEITLSQVSDVELSTTMSAALSNEQADPPPIEPASTTIVSRLTTLAEILQSRKSGDILGCVSLKPFATNLHEVRSFAVWPPWQGNRVGTKLLEAAKDAAPAGKLFTLTFAPAFFERHGFKVVNKSELPEKIYSDCRFCPFVDDCNETALVWSKNA